MPLILSPHPASDCLSSYGDLVVHALDMHLHTTGVGALSLAALAAVGLAALAIMVHAKGRHVRIIGGLGQPIDCFGQLSKSTTRHGTSAGVLRPSS